MSSSGYESSVLNQLLQHPKGQTVSQVSGSLDMLGSTTRRVLNRLKTAGFVKVDKGNGTAVWHGVRPPVDVGESPVVDTPVDELVKMLEVNTPPQAKKPEPKKPSSKKKQKDPSVAELDAMHDLLDILRPLEPDARERVVKWVIETMRISPL